MKLSITVEFLGVASTRTVDASHVANLSALASQTAQTALYDSLNALADIYEGTAEIPGQSHPLQPSHKEKKLQEN